MSNMAEVQFFYPDIRNPEEDCQYKCTEGMIAHYVNGRHSKPAKNVKEEDKNTSKKAKRMEGKPPKFIGKETREEFRRKHAEFKSYSVRALLEGEDVSDDIYLACETPLKRKLHKIKSKEL